MKVNLKQQYKYSPDGNTVITAGPGEADLPGRFAEKAKKAGLVARSGKASTRKATKPAANKAAKPSENK